MTRSKLYERVLIIAPVGQDASAIAERLDSRGFVIQICQTPGECCRYISEGAAVLLLTEEALELPQISRLTELLQAQPPWSELPLIVLTNGGESRLARLLDAITAAAGSATLLERPIGAATLVRSVEVALRSRRRQYQVRDLLDEQQRKQQQLYDLTHHLEKRVEERTYQLKEQSDQLRRLAVELTEFEEKERKRLAQILHDHLQQLLVAARMRLDWLERQSGDMDKRALVEIQTYLSEAYDSSRSLTAELRPPVLYEGGLGAALHFLVRKFQEQQRLRVQLSFIDAEPHSDLFKTVIYQSVQELLFNIVKYAGIEECFVELKRLADGQIRIVVRDQGAGFDPRDIGKRSVGGFGLFSIRERMKALGGTFNIDSSPGQGTTVEILLHDDVIVPEENVAKAVVQVRKTKMDGLLTILLADDHKIVRQSLAMVLVAQPFIDQVLEAEDGQDAVTKVAESHPDVVIMDLNMPKMNGIEATRVLHQIHPDLKIIGLSVQAEEETAQAMKAAGAIDYFSKDTDTDILIDKLKSLRDV